MESTITTMPRIGDIAPDFEANRTLGNLRFSENAKGKWTILFSHPSAELVPGEKAIVPPTKKGR